MYDEAAGGGAANDPNSARNAPLNNPVAHLDKIYFHSDLDYMEVHDESDVLINHALVSTTGGPVGGSIQWGWNTSAVDHLLYTHGLGYAPFALVSVGANIIWPGMPVQTDAGGGGGGRYCSIYTTTTGVYLREFASIGNAALPAISLTYKVLTFKNPTAGSGVQLIDWNPGTGVFKAGKGKFDSSRKYLQVVPGGSPLGLSYGRTIDLKNGAVRAVRPDGTYYDPVPATLFGYLVGGTDTPGAYMNYNGSFTGPGAIQVQAP